MNRTFLHTCLAALLLGATILHAQDAVSDSIHAANQTSDMAAKIDDIHHDVRDIHRELIDSPLGNRSWGFEIDPVLLLFADAGGGIYGTVSNFSLDRSAEIAFPFSYESLNADGGSLVLNLDGQYRYFLSGRQRGFYVSGFARYQHAQYRDLADYFSDSTAAKRNLNRVGIGFGIGSRIFSRSGFYWGWNLSIGRFIAGNKVNSSDLPDEPSLWLGDLIIDVELLKIGFAI